MAKDNEKPRNRLEELKGHLYERGWSDEKRTSRSTYYAPVLSVRTEWDSEEAMSAPHKKKNTTFFKKIFIASLAFFVVAIVLGFYFVSRGGGNSISSENVVIEIFGPIATEGGKELSLQVAVTNKNSVPLEFADLVIEYPEGTRTSGDGASGKELARFRKGLSSIASGETVHEIVRAVLFGKEGSLNDINVSVEYRVAGSNAIFVSEKNYPISLSSSPLSVSLELLKEVNANQEMEIRARLVSNSDEVIKDAIVRVDYPFGFEFKESNPKPAFGKNIWEMGDIASKASKEIVIRGIMRGQDNEQKIFSMYVGPRDTARERDIGAVYSSTFEEVAIKKPFLSVDLTLDGETSEEYIADGGTEIRGTLLWTNNLPSLLTDVVIEMAFQGDSLNKRSVRSEGGFYDSTRNVIIWDKSKRAQLSSVAAGNGDEFPFAFAAKDFFSAEGVSLRNPSMTLRVSIRGKRTGESGAAEEVSEFVERTVKFNSAIELSARAVYSMGPFKNKGPLPPRVGEETTYTIILTAQNTANNLVQAEARALLPSYARFIGTISPSDAGLSYNARTGEVTWKTGVLSAGTSKQGKEVAFQIGFMPSITQVGESPELVKNIVLSAEDTFTGSLLRRIKQPLTTLLSTDPAFSPVQAQVIQ